MARGHKKFKQGHTKPKAKVFCPSNGKMPVTQGPAHFGDPGPMDIIMSSEKFEDIAATKS